MPYSRLPLLIGKAPPPSSTFLSLPPFSQLRLLMANSNSKPNPNSSSDKLRQLVNSAPSGGWERCWEEGLTPWDLGRPTPILQHLLEEKSIPNGRALVPGCGSGYDVVALASPERYTIGLDISEVAIKKARQVGPLCAWFKLRCLSWCRKSVFDYTSTVQELAASSPNVNFCSFLLADFFSWKPTHLFDFIFDYTFFCAIEPSLRSTWAKCMRELLKPDGELITLMFPIDDFEGGPPYKTSVADYEDVLHSVGFQATSIVENELAVPPRKGREKLGRWRRIREASTL